VILNSNRFDQSVSYDDHVYRGVLAPQLKGVRDLYDDITSRNYASALVVLIFFLGERWVEKNIKLAQNSISYMKNNYSELSIDRYQHQDRVISLADHLFGLRGCRNFWALVARVVRSDIASCFAEIEAARMLYLDGYDIEITQETGRRGSDFDFVAYRNGAAVAIEVTALARAERVDVRVTNKLQKKRSQFPADKPAVLFIKMPQMDEDTPYDDREIELRILRFFSSSSRINILFLVFEHMEQVERAGMLRFTGTRKFQNANARHPMPSGPPRKVPNAGRDLRILRYLHPILFQYMLNIDMSENYISFNQYFTEVFTRFLD
jgi:hypothetical protein